MPKAASRSKVLNLIIFSQEKHQLANPRPKLLKLRPLKPKLPNQKHPKLPLLLNRLLPKLPLPQKERKVPKVVPRQRRQRPLKKQHLNQKAQEKQRRLPKQRNDFDVIDHL